MSTATDVRMWPVMLVLLSISASAAGAQGAGRVEVSPHAVPGPGSQAGGFAPCTGGEDISQTWTNNATALNLQDNSAIGQSITAPCTGIIEVISFSVATVAVPGLLNLSVYQGAGDTGAVLGSVTVDVQSAGAHAVDLPQPIGVSDGSVYTFKLSVPTGQGTSATFADWWGGGNGERYPGGTEYNVAFGGGGTFFGPDPEYDLTFGVDFEPPVPAGCDVVQLLSDGAIDLNAGLNPALGQSFRAPCDGVVRSVSFWVWTLGEPGPLALALHAGPGDSGALLSTGTVDVQGIGLHTVSLATPVPVTDNSTYTFKLTVPAGQATAVDLQEHSQNPYGGGMEYNVAYAGGGSAFAGDPQYDLAFGVDIDIASTSEPPPSASQADLTLTAVTPNPVVGVATMSLRATRAQRVLVTLMDALGRRVATLLDGSLAAGAHEITIDARLLPPGAYVVRATAAGGVAARRFVVR